MSPPSKRMKTTERVTTIEDLPPEMICELFEHLHLKDLAACSLVNKRWHSIYSNFKVHSLVAIRSEDPFNWHGSNETVEEKCICPPAMFCRLIEKPLLSNLKHLALGGSQFDLNKLNRFQQLVHLEINGIRGVHLNLHLNLPKLKVLAFHGSNENCPLSIDCPLLSTLVYGELEDVNLLKVMHPETIQKLQTDVVGEKLAPFESVECLVTTNSEAISLATLRSLPKLRELHYNQDIESLFEDEFRNETGKVDRVKRTLSEFLSETKLRGSDFRFTFAGLQLNNVNVDQIDFEVQVDRFGEDRVYNEYVYMKNYHLIERGALHFVYHVDYTRLLSHVTGEFPRCFSQKFTDIHVVYATAEVQDPDHFLWFLKSLRSLRSLWLDETELGQAFYDQLPAAAPSLYKLFFRGYHYDMLQLNFDFIGRLSHLSRLEIDPKIPLESAISLTKLLGRLEVRFHVQSSKEECFEIEKSRGSTEWKISMDAAKRYATRRRKRKPSRFNTINCRAVVFETENLDEIVEFTERLHEDLPWRTFYTKKLEIYRREKKMKEMEKEKEKSAKSD